MVRNRKYHAALASLIEGPMGTGLHWIVSYGQHGSRCAEVQRRRYTDRDGCLCRAKTSGWLATFDELVGAYRHIQALEYVQRHNPDEWLELEEQLEWAKTYYTQKFPAQH
jgi:hypothetical protein